MNRLALALALALVACNKDSSARPPAAAATPVTAATGGPAALDALDKRTPVPLLPMMADHQKRNMRDHLLAVQQIVAAVAVDDFAGIEQAASRIGFSEPMGQMCEHMGTGAPGFTELALAFHHQADRITVAARAGDKVGVLAELGTTLQACTGCHEQWKQQVVDEAGWQRVAGAPPPMAHGAGH